MLYIMYYNIIYTPRVLDEFVGIHYYISLLVGLVYTSKVYIYYYILFYLFIVKRQPITHVDNVVAFGQHNHGYVCIAEQCFFFFFYRLDESHVVYAF